MAKLIYSAITSLDGYVADEDGNFDWSMPDEEVHTFINDLERPVGTYLYGRRMYEVMVPWETAHTLADLPAYERDFTAIWQSAEKIVYSTTLQTAFSARTRIEHASSIPKRSGGSRRHRRVTSPWPVPTSPRRRSRPAWWTSGTCSSRRSWWEAASRRSPTRSA